MTHLSVSTLRNSLLLCALAAGAFLTTSSAVAQEQAVVVQVPFAFENGTQHLPAGKYRIDLNSEPLMSLHGTVANSAGFAMTIPAITSKPSQRGKVVFHRYGNRYFLSEVWMAGESTGRVCVMSRREKNLQIAQNAAAITNTELALNAPAR
jgi:type IV secretory pathway protease TraF